MPPWRKLPAPSSPTTEAQGPSSDAPPPDAAHLWEEANKALGDLLTIKSSIDACQWKLVSEFSMALHENDSKTRVYQGSKGHLYHSIQEAENCCSVAIREAEAQRASQAVSIQQSHHKLVSTLKRNLLKRRERVSSTSSLSVRLPCRPALQILWHAGSFLPHFAGTCTNALISLAFPKELHPFHQGPP